MGRFRRAVRRQTAKTEASRGRDVLELGFDRTTAGEWEFLKMELGQILLKKNLATQEQIDMAVELQSRTGGRLGDCLVSLEVISEEQLNGILNRAPRAPESLEEMGISEGDAEITVVDRGSRGFPWSS